ncbi:ATP-binding protein [Anaerolinea thermophila]|uniref:hybrid sensor histidine kinase/response regulator n=2 Tax=Anaerolinea TaxID=233189 RepID=UPI0026ECAFC2|nr:ATP-binding protein [Anaerolinea thermophila]
MLPQTTETILIATPNPQVNFLLERMIRSMGYGVFICADRASLKSIPSGLAPTMIFVSEKMDGESAEMETAQELAYRFPAAPAVLFVERDQPEKLKAAMRLGFIDYLSLPLRTDDILRVLRHALEIGRLRREAILIETRRATASLQQRLDELETLARLGRTVVSSLDLDHVLGAVVDAAVEMTGAEEGSLLMLDPATGELYMRAARNFNEDFVRTFRLPVKDTLAGTVIRTGQPVLLDDSTPQKIKTTYLVQSLLYVPLAVHGHTFGVLGVDNRQRGTSFSEHHLKLLGALAEFATIAIENARLYTETIAERRKLETVLTNVQDGVVLMDREKRLLLVNQTVRQAFSLPENHLVGRSFRDVFTHPALLELLEGLDNGTDRTELQVEDGRYFAVRASPIPEVGTALTFSDITNLKKLDQIKSDFVHTVSHDLRSPLTAILGYVELIERVGTVNDLQRDFIRRIQVSVHNITSLVDDLLDLGRIEAGFDTRKEPVALDTIIRYSVEGFKKALGEKGHTLQLDLPAQSPSLLANPVQMRQMVDNLLDNAIKYTPQGGRIQVSLRVEGNQLLFQVSDNGIGIPPIDLPYVFDKFYRASNAAPDVSGTGLGLAIVKSIVEAHEGRIWVDSAVGSGSTFTVVLPLSGG